MFYCMCKYPGACPFPHDDDSRDSDFLTQLCVPCGTTAEKAQPLYDEIDAIAAETEVATRWQSVQCPFREKLGCCSLAHGGVRVRMQMEDCESVYASVNKLEYTQAFMTETLRLYPSVPVDGALGGSRTRIISAAAWLLTERALARALC